MDSQQELFTALKVQLEKALKSKGINVYDTFLPSEGTPYPYVYIGSSQLVDDYGNKTMILGNTARKPKIKVMRNPGSAPIARLC